MSTSQGAVALPGVSVLSAAQLKQPELLNSSVLTEVMPAEGGTDISPVLQKAEAFNYSLGVHISH